VSDNLINFVSIDAMKMLLLVVIFCIQSSYFEERHIFVHFS